MSDVTVEQSYNLLDEPWLPVLGADGLPRHVSLVQLFEQASAIRTLGGDLPTQAFALLRLALAAFYRAVPLRTTDHYATLAADYDTAAERTVRHLEAHRDRFWLFHPKTPFFQVSGLASGKGAASPVSKIIADLPDGKRFLTQRSGSSAESVSPAEAARWLVHAHAFDTSGIKTGVVGDPRSKGGKAYPEGVAWAGNLGGIYLQGQTLARTLMLNLVGASVTPDRAVENDLASWERPHLGVGVRPPEAGGEQPAGPVDLFTWQSRRVRLIQDGNGRVSSLVLTYGDTPGTQNRHNVEPLSTWQHSENQTKVHGFAVRMPRRHRPSVQMWRNLSGLLAQDVHHQNTPVVDWADQLRGQGHLQGTVRVCSVGAVYGPQSSVYDEIVADSLDLPAAVLGPDGRRLALAAVDAVTVATQAVLAVVNLASNLAAAAGADLTDGLRDATRADAYARLDLPFRDWLRELSEDTVPDDATARWQRTARDVIQGMAAELVTATPSSAWRGRPRQGRHIDVGQAEAWFRRALAKALPGSLASRGAATTQEEKS